MDGLAIVVLRFPFFPEVQLEPDPLCSVLWKLNASEREDMPDPLPFRELESFRFSFTRGLPSSFDVGAGEEVKVAAASATSSMG